MPYVFDPDAAVLYASLPDVEIDEAAFALQEEEFLLTHKCRRSAECQTERVMGQRVSGGGATVEPEAHCILRIDFDQQLEFHIEATALSLRGLANHHPGAGLDDYGLAFLNGSAGEELPFRFTGGTWIYMEPSQECVAGDLAEISFRVVREFTDLLEGSGEPPPTDPEPYTLILRQNAGQPVTSVVETMALTDIFNATASFTGDFTVALYFGDPTGAGVAVSEAVPLIPWNEITAAADANTVQLRNPDIITWLPGAGARTVTHVLYKRGTTVIASGPLEFPVSVPAGYGIRADDNALAIELRWPLDGAQPAVVNEWPAANVLKYIVGAMDIPTENFLIEVWSADPQPAGGFGILLDSVAVARNSAVWTVLGDAAANADFIVGVNPAPPGGWPVEFYTVSILTMPVMFLKKAVPGVVGEGSVFSQPAGALNIELHS